MDRRAVRARIREDHGRLREQLAEIEVLAGRFEKDGFEVGEELRALGVDLCEVFAAHLRFEDAQLGPLLAAVPDRGAELAERLALEHCEQRELLEFLVGRLSRERRPTTLVARELLSFCEYLRQDMAHEEAALLRD